MSKYAFLLTALALIPFGAVAQDAQDDLSYTFIETDWINLDIDNFDDDEDLLEDLDDGNGWAVRASFGFLENWFAFANYSSTESDTGFFDEFDAFFPSNTDIDRFDLGGGFHWPLYDNVDLVVRAAYTDVDLGSFDLGGRGDDDSVDDFFDDLNEDSSDGYFGDVAVRAQITDWLEGSIGGRYTDIERVDDFSAFGSLLFEINPNIGFNVGFEAGGDITTYSVGARYNFRFNS